ncbi:MAG: stage III sporulation protein AG [Oscillospiraceae bacterium]|nr:stage III sporulation protein AG [Oscillospiraceae bacterium]
MDREEGKRKWIKPLEILNRYKYVLLVALLGAALLLWPTRPKPAESSGPQTGGSTSTAEMEQAMEAILAKISGVGRVDVMLTLQSGSELVLAQDTTLRYSGSAQAPDDYQRSSDTVSDSGGVVVTQEVYPKYRGALVVCDGGGSDAVRLEVVAAVSALTGLGSDRITVVQWQRAASGQ